MNKIIIYGVGKLAEFIYYSFTHDSKYEVSAFCVDEDFLQAAGESVFGLPILSFNDVLLKFPPDSYLMHIAVGRNSARSFLYHKVEQAGYQFANYICSKANVWPDLVIGKNVFIDQASVIQPFVTIENNCILIKAGIGHHCSIGSDSLLSGTSIAGNVKIGKECFLGLNSAVKENICIGNYNIVGGSCFIGKDTVDYTLTYQDRSVQKKKICKNLVLFK
ncbi:acetyltransferase [Chryseobacterium sp. Leaf394]|uniref:acetyltransferase n=1 Tax=Chryseobacterium sp. Leaf394 TaxID=1736361 RepID=UPI0006F1ECD3|nr:acetyltransferase [Chryseobacterium sp. Leaf394]KQS95204.1 hypothetical protein ASG21_17340 [Chryseobacterium sp. Leaf394]